MLILEVLIVFLTSFSLEYLDLSENDLSHATN
jgi:hypothetical protein